MMVGTRTTSPLRYPGSKARLAPLVAEAVRFAGCEGGLLIEPFCGGASVSVALLEAGVVSAVALNDADPAVAAFWQVVFSPDAEWLARAILEAPLTLYEWDRQRALVPATSRETALRTVYLNRTSFNGILHAHAGPIGGRTQARYTLGARFDRERVAARIRELTHLRARVTVGCEHWAEFCTRHTVADRAFVFLDPPYYRKAETLYGQSFGDEDHRDLRNHLVLMSTPWLLSYDDTPEVRERLDGWRYATLGTRNVYSAHPRGGNSARGRERLYSNVRRLARALRRTPPKPQHGLQLVGRAFAASKPAPRRAPSAQRDLFPAGCGAQLDLNLA